MKVLITRQLNWSINWHGLGSLVISVVHDFFTPGRAATNLGKLENSANFNFSENLTKTQANFNYFWKR